MHFLIGSHTKSARQARVVIPHTLLPFTHLTGSAHRPCSSPS